MAEDSVPDPFGAFKPKYNVHPESYDFIRRVAEMKPQPLWLLSPEDARAQSRDIGIKLSEPVSFDGTVTSMTVPSDDLPDGIPLTVYRPSSTKPKPAILIFLHGGGLVIGCLEPFDPFLKTISKQTGSVIAFVHYRLLPNKDHVTAPFDDAITATRWVMANKELVGGHVDSKLGVAGDSSGGHLTASITNEVRDLDFQILVYPVADLSMKQASVEEFAECPGLPKQLMDWYVANSLEHIPNALTDPRINPMARSEANTKLSPPALILLAELDMLRDGGIDYAEKLRSAGVDVELKIIPGVPHSFFQRIEVFKTVGLQACSHFSAFINKFQ